MDRLILIVEKGPVIEKADDRGVAANQVPSTVYIIRKIWLSIITGSGPYCRNRSGGDMLTRIMLQRTAEQQTAAPTIGPLETYWSSGSGPWRGSHDSW
jgi:hypothetical protein